MPHRYLFQLTTAVVLLLAWSPITHAQVDWTHYSTEAVLDAFDEEWPEDGVWTPTVVRAEGATIIGFGNSLYAINTRFFDLIFGDPALVQSEVVRLRK